MRTPEGEVKAAAKKWFKGRDAYLFMPVNTGYGKRTLDFLICMSGRFIACEAKRRNGRGQAFQQKIAEEIRNVGGIAFIFDDVEDLEEQFAMEGLIQRRLYRREK
jgi:hypothetical protein